MSDAKTITTADGTSFECGSGDTILRAALRAGQGMPYSCNTGSCGNCRFELLDGAVHHMRQDPPAWGERDVKRNRWLGCQATPDGDCKIKFRPDPDAVSRYRPMVRKGSLVSVTPLTRDISKFRIDLEGADDFQPGQYALIFVPGVEGGRPYSMSNLSGDGCWEFLIKRTPNGAATSWLFDEARPGDEVTVDGPYGTAWLRMDAPRDLLLMAGGSGLSPMVSIARGAMKAGLLEDRKLRFFYGGRSEADMFDAATALGAELADRITLVAALSEAGEDWTGPRGFLHDVVAGDLADTLKDNELYFAGPAAMSGAVQKMAYEAGLPTSNMHFDEFY